MWNSFFNFRRTTNTFTTSNLLKIQFITFENILPLQFATESHPDNFLTVNAKTIETIKNQIEKIITKRQVSH